MAQPKLGKCQTIFLVLEVENPRSLQSLDIMASTSSYLEQGYEKLFRWCSYEFRQVGRDSQLEVGTTMGEAVRRLRGRPELLRSVYL